MGSAGRRLVRPVCLASHNAKNIRFLEELRSRIEVREDRGRRDPLLYYWPFDKQSIYRCGSECEESWAGTEYSAAYKLGRQADTSWRYLARRPATLSSPDQVLG